MNIILIHVLVVDGLLRPLIGGVLEFLYFACNILWNCNNLWVTIKPSADFLRVFADHNSWLLRLLHFKSCQMINLFVTFILFWRISMYEVAHLAKYSSAISVYIFVYWLKVLYQQNIFNTWLENQHAIVFDDKRNQ